MIRLRASRLLRQLTQTSGEMQERFGKGVVLEQLESYPNMLAVRKLRRIDPAGLEIGQHGRPNHSPA